MATKAKKQQAQPKSDVLAVVASLTKARMDTSKSSSSKKLLIEGHEDLVDELAGRHKEIESLQADQDQQLDELRELARSRMIAEESNGDFFKSCQVKGHVQNARVTRSDAYSKIELAHRNKLVDLVGAELFGQLFQEGADLKLKVPIALFEAAMEAAGLDIKQYFERVDWVKPIKGFLEKRAALRLGLEDDTNTALDAIVDAVQYRPGVGFKA